MAKKRRKRKRIIQYTPPKEPKSKEPESKVPEAEVPKVISSVIVDAAVQI